MPHTSTLFDPTLFRVDKRNRDEEATVSHAIRSAMIDALLLRPTSGLEIDSLFCARCRTKTRHVLAFPRSWGSTSHRCVLDWLGAWVANRAALANNPLKSKHTSRSANPPLHQQYSLAGWQSGHAEDCKSLYVGSIPARASKLKPLHRPVLAGPAGGDGWPTARGRRLRSLRRSMRLIRGSDRLSEIRAGQAYSKP